MGRLREQLEQEWESLAFRPGAEAALRRWAAGDDRLKGFDGFGELIVFLGQPPSARAANDVLAALVRLSAGDALARRCLLHGLIPGLVQLAGFYPSAGEDPDDRLQTVLMFAMERIRDLSGGEVEWPAATILGSVRDRLRRAVPSGVQEPNLPIEDAITVPARPDRSAAEELAGLLVSGLRRGSIRREDAALIYTTRVAGHPSSMVASVLGMDPVAVRARRRRAEQRLAGTSASVC